MRALRPHVIALPALLAPLFLATCSEPLTSPPAPVPVVPAASVVHSSGIVINEVMPDPNAASDDNGEWFELHNTSSTSVSVSGWAIVSNNDAAHTISGSVSVPAGGYRVFVRNGRKNNNGGISGGYEYGSGITLANASDWLVVRNGAGETVDSVAWTSSPTGATRGVSDPLADNADVNGANWHTATSTYGKGDKGTPGAQNDGYTPPVGPPAVVTVTPASATVTVGATQPFSASAVDANGTPVATSFSWSSSDAATATVDASGVATGIAAGSAQIRATASNGVWGEAALTVQSGGGDGSGTPGELVVRVLDVGQGDATYITDGVSKVLIDGGQSMSTLGAHLDALGLNNQTIDVVIISHAHFDHYGGLRELFKTARGITIRYLFENKDAGTQVSLAELRDSINARVGRGELIYRDTDDPCVNGASLCTITMAGGAKLHVLRPDPGAGDPNNRSGVVKLIGPDSASFTMWFAGDAEREAIAWFDDGAQYDAAPGMDVNVLKADHHGSCNGVTQRYLELITPDWIAIGVGGSNTFGHVHTQTKDLMTSLSIPWYRTDQNGTITFRTPGTAGGGYTVSVEKGQASMSGSTDKTASSTTCSSM